MIQVERVNSAGTLTSGNISLGWDDPPSMRFYYGTSDGFDGRVVTRVAYYDIYDQKLYEKHYSGDLRALDFVQSEQNSTSFSLGTDLLSSQAFVGGSQSRGDVIRYIQTYDENGYLTKRMFKRDNRGSSGGTPTRDENGVWGVEYLRDDSGRIAGTRFLDQGGAFMADKTGSAGCDYTYVQSGRVSSETCVDLSGMPSIDDENIARTALEYDELGRVVELARFDLDGGRVNRSSEGASVIRYGYDNRGFVTSTETYDHMLEPCCDTTGIFRNEHTLDDNGWPVRQDSYGPDGQPHPCSNGFASMTCVRAANGQITQMRYFSADGEPAPDLSVNAYGVDYTYTDGLCTRADYLDSQGRPMASKWGYASICREYNSERQLSREWYLDEDGQPTRSAANGIAECRCTYTDGNCTGYDYYDETGALCLDNCGVASYTLTYESGQLVAESCFGTEGEPVLHKEGWHSFSKTYDENGLLLRQCSYGTENQRVRANTGYSAISYTYDDTGRMTSETFYDTQDRPSSSVGTVISYAASQLQYEYDQRGNLVRKVYCRDHDIPGEVWDVVYTYDGHGNTTSERWQDYQGELVMSRSGSAYAEADYDAFGRAMENRWYDEKGGLVSRDVYEYDSLGRTTRETIYEEDGSVRLVTNNMYDEFGNWIEKSFTDGDGKPCMSTEGYATARFAYDSFCNIKESWAYDETGNPREGIFHQIMTYSVSGI